jgi:hypothetical protein
MEMKRSVMRKVAYVASSLWLSYCKPVAPKKLKRGVTRTTSQSTSTKERALCPPHS